MALVVTYHLWPTAVPAGYVGVDAFFVISGFLITAQLVRDVERHGRVQLLGFWARRVRRLLPAALLVLLVVAAVVWLFVPEGLWQQFFREIGGSSVYLQNWVLVSDSVDYFSSSNGASPVQNFWSLSVEEQFYLFWPLLIIIPLLLPIRGSHKRIWTLALLATGTVASFIYGIHLTHADSSVSYLATTSRAWEFGVGGILALLSLPNRITPSVRAALSWAGLVAIVGSAFVYNANTPFPGTAALLPIAGVLAVIAAGMPEVRWASSALMRVAPVQKLGDVSYSLYLWHWPLIVLVPFIIAKYLPSYNGLGPVALVLVLVASVALAFLSKRFVEDPGRFAGFLARHRPRRTFVFMAAAMAAVVAVSGLGWSVVQLDTETSKATEAALVSQNPTCLGAAALDPALKPCTNTTLSNVLIPTPVVASSEIPASCQVGATDSTVSVCYAGASSKNATTTVALVGDSHAAQWLPALEVVAKQNHWRIAEILKASCAFNTSTREATGEALTSCAEWNTGVQKKLASMTGVSAIFTSADVKDLFVPTSSATGFQNAVSGYVSAWSGLPSSIQKVYVLRDTPRPEANVQTCLQLRTTSSRLAAGACSIPRKDAVPADPLVTAAAKDSSRAVLVDLDNYFCTSTTCDPVVGHVLVYRDSDHLTTTYARTLAPYLAARL